MVRVDQVIHNKKVAPVVPSGARVKARVAAWEREAFRRRVSSTSDEKVLAERKIHCASSRSHRVGGCSDSWRKVNPFLSMTSHSDHRGADLRRL